MEDEKKTNAEPVSSPEESGDKEMPPELELVSEELDLQSQLARLSEEVETYKERWLRLAAEFDNYKKRTAREFSALVKNANTSLLTQFLPVADNLERALQTPQTVEEAKTFALGVDLIRQQFFELLRKEGVQEIEAAGQPFDPNQHEAIMAVEQEDQPEQTIKDVVEKGYRLNERVLRPAKVIVTRKPV